MILDTLLDRSIALGFRTPQQGAAGIDSAGL
jgi:hypothetical protein